MKTDKKNNAYIMTVNQRVSGSSPEGGAKEGHHWVTLFLWAIVALIIVWITKGAHTTEDFFSLNPPKITQ